MKGEYIQNFVIGWLDIQLAFRRYFQITALGQQDVATRYRRSRIGAFWLTINMAVIIAALGLIFGKLFQQQTSNFLPYLAIGFIIWGFLTNNINEACSGFSASEGIILHTDMPLFTHLGRIVWRNTIILAHNLLILPFIFIIFFRPVTPIVFLSVIGFILQIINLTWIMLIMALICARYRDLTLMTQNFIQIIFYLTPIIWMPAQLTGRELSFIVDWNPFYYLIEIVRAPLLGQVPSSQSYIILIVMAVLGWLIAIPFFGRDRKRVAYWL